MANWHSIMQPTLLKKKPAAGFTLLEVLVALAIFSIVVAALIFKSSQSITQTQFLEEKSYALWIAENKLTELRIDSKWPSLGQKSDTLSQFEREWTVEVEVDGTGQPSLREVNVQVRRSEDKKVLANLSSYIGQY